MTCFTIQLYSATILWKIFCSQSFCSNCLAFQNVLMLRPLYCMQQASPKKICSQVGLCTFDGNRGVRSGSNSQVFSGVFDFQKCCCQTSNTFPIPCCYSHWFYFQNVTCSMGIESVVDEIEGRSSGIMHDAMCSACEMAVVWMQSQLQQNQTQEHVLNYVNEVIFCLVSYCYSHSIFVSPKFVMLFSSVIRFLAQMENLLWTVKSFHPCPLFHSPSVTMFSTSAQTRFDFNLPTS